MQNLKVFKILEPAAKEFLEIALEERNLDLGKFTDYVHFQEDYLLQSEKYPIFAVADGVTLEFDKDGSYPIPSGASAVAHIFCEKIIEEAEKLYNNFSEEDIKIVFGKANGAVGKYNLKNGRTKEAINFWDFDLFAATGALAVIKNNTVWWGSICDSYLAHFDKNGSLKFMSGECWPTMRQNLPENWERISDDERKKIIRKVYRNGVDKAGNLIGYGVVTGEKVAEQYLNCGSITVAAGDLIALLTDGFEEYMKLPEFINSFKEWPKDLEDKIKQFTAEKSKEDPEGFGHERTLTVIKI